MAHQSAPPSYSRPGLFTAGDPPLQVTHCTAADLDHQRLESLVSLAQSCGAVGIAATFSKRGVLETLAIACQATVLSVVLGKGATTGKKQKKDKGKGKPDDTLQERLLTNAAIHKIGFDMDRLTTALYYDHRLLISSALDAQSTSTKTGPRYSKTVLLGALGDEKDLNKTNALRVLLGEERPGDELEYAALRAYAAWKISTSVAYARRRPTFKIISTDKIATSVRMTLRPVALP